jgi:hypothetical protein
LKDCLKSILSTTGGKVSSLSLDADKYDVMMSVHPSSSKDRLMKKLGVSQSVAS